jgi:hypothetical protein
MTIEMFGQSSVAAAEHMIMKDGIDENMSSVTKAYLNIYKSARVGSMKSMEYLKSVIDILNQISKTETFNQGYLGIYGLNRWMEDGQKNINSI